MFIKGISWFVSKNKIFHFFIWIKILYIYIPYVRYVLGTNKLLGFAKYPAFGMLFSSELHRLTVTEQSPQSSLFRNFQNIFCNSF